MVENYHTNLLKNVKMIIAVMGFKNVTELNKEHLMLADESGKIHHDVKRVMDKKIRE